jgi:hypothetical protein
MRTILKCSLIILLMTIGSMAQQPLQPGTRIRQPSFYPPNEGSAGKPATNNYQLELIIQKDQKTASYKVTLNGGSVNTELIDRSVEKPEGAAPQTITLNATLIPFEDGGGEVQLNLGRYVAYRTKAQVQGAPAGTEKEVTASKSIPLMTKVALFPNKPVTVFEDEGEKISLKLTLLDSENQK